MLLRTITNDILIMKNKASSTKSDPSPPGSKEVARDTEPSRKVAPSTPGSSERRMYKQTVASSNQEETEGIEDKVKRLIDENIRHSQNTRLYRNRLIGFYLFLGLWPPISIYIQWPIKVLEMGPIPQSIFISVSFIVFISLCGFAFASLKGSAANNEIGAMNYLSNIIRGYRPPGSE